MRGIAYRASHARIVVVTYPAILPSLGTCTHIGIGSMEAALLRKVGARLAEVTREAAARRDGVYPAQLPLKSYEPLQIGDK